MRNPSLALALSFVLVTPRLSAQAPSPMHDTTAYTAVATGLRAQPQATAAVLTHLPAGYPVHVTSCAGGWCAAVTTAFTGFLPADSLTLVTPPGAPGPGAAAVTPGASIGVDLSSRLVLGFTAAPKLRVAPEASYVSRQSKSYANSSTIGTYTVDGSESELWLGLGLYYITPVAVRPLGAPCLVYLGPRGGVAFVSSEEKVENANIPSDATAKRTDYWVGAAVGSELMVSKRFSVGAEAEVTKVFAGSADVGGVTVTSVGVGQSWVDLATQGTVVLRFYP